jgi:ABC transport system ATP-binding/permease protein
LLSGVLVKFDKLNPAVAKQGVVPFWGEIMVSRWGFEALAVNQFMNNEYERLFYPFEKKYEQADFKTIYWLDRINKKMERIKLNQGKKDLINQQKTDLLLLKTELTLEKTEASENAYSLVFPDYDKLSITSDGKISDAAALTMLSDWLNNDYKSFYNRQSNYYRYDCKDAVVMALEKKDLPNLTKVVSKQSGIKHKNDYNSFAQTAVSRLINYDSMAFACFQQDFSNQALSDLVMNKNDLSEKILEKNGALIQRTNPIYLNPVNNYGRAHFFAPVKKFFGNYFSTFHFNICVIWLMSIILAVTLYFDFFRKTLDFFGSGLGKLRRRKN